MASHSQGTAHLTQTAVWNKKYKFTIPCSSAESNSSKPLIQISLNFSWKRWQVKIEKVSYKNNINDIIKRPKTIEPSPAPHFLLFIKPSHVALLLDKQKCKSSVSSQLHYGSTDCPCFCVRVASFNNYL